LWFEKDHFATFLLKKSNFWFFQSPSGINRILLNKVSTWKIEYNGFSLNAEKYIRGMTPTLTRAQDNIVEAQAIQEKY
jgi:hypothetical protein